MTCRKLLLLAVVPVMVSASAQAADLGGGPPVERSYDADTRPALQWYGLYVGANAGYSFGHDSYREASAAPFDGTDLEKFRASSSGFMGGGQIGYNYQVGHVVMGVEADLYYANLSHSVSSASGAVTASSSGNLVGSVRPRLGYAMGPWLIYSTGGIAYGNAKSAIVDNTGNTLSASNSDTRIGWVAGGGIEYALDRNWSVRTEFLHTDLGHATVSGVALDGNTYSWRDRVTDNVMRVGVNYRF